MVYQEATAERVRRRIGARSGVSEQHMFGGVGFLLRGNLCVAVWKDYLILRVGPDAYRTALQQPGAKEFDITGRVMRGWVMVAPAGYAAAATFRMWIDLAMDFVRSLPPK